MIPQFMLFPLLLIGLCLPHFTQRKNILYANLLLVSGYSITMLIYGQDLGALIYFVAAIGTTSQIILGEKWGRKGTYIRIGIAAFLVLCGASILYDAPTDLIAIVAFAGARFAETCTKPQNIRRGLLCSGSLFLLYAGVSGVWPVFIAQLTLVISILFALAFNSGHLKKPQINLIKIAFK
jgi:hypothetical protein